MGNRLPGVFHSHGQLQVQAKKAGCPLPQQEKTTGSNGLMDRHDRGSSDPDRTATLWHPLFVPIACRCGNRPLCFLGRRPTPPLDTCIIPGYRFHLNRSICPFPAACEPDQSRLRWLGLKFWAQSEFSRRHFSGSPLRVNLSPSRLVVGEHAEPNATTIADPCQHRICRRRFFDLTLQENFSPSWESRNACWLANAFVPTIWLPWPFGRFQWDRLGQPEKWLDSEQVGQQVRLFRQKLVKGLHSRM
jgi:hypothetical protein